ncbi:MAG: carbohydrate ABC transporter permease [Chloroflexota bacterium]|nr:carbohydrate ABC transporter permease [Chloroflexota bacterium]
MNVALRRISDAPWLIHLVLVLGVMVMVGPFVWMILTSLKTLGEATRVPPVVLPSVWQWNNYRDVWLTLPFANFYTNTILMTAGRTIGQVVFCSMAAYAFARIQFPGRNFLFILFLSVLMVPAQVFLIPQYLIMARLGWVNTLQALIVPGMFSAFGTFLLRQFFMSMPLELEEAAKLDGANHFQIYARVMLPLAKSGLIALAIITIRWSWNDLLWPLIVINSPTKTVLSAGIASLQGQYLTHYPVLMAGAALATWPLILMFFLFQRHFVEGIALSGSKG